MAMNIVLPQTRGNEASVKDLIISVLSREWPLNVRKIYNRVSKVYTISCSYQAVHKSIKKLVRGGVLIKKGREYYLNIGWLEQIKKFSERVKEEYLSKESGEEISDSALSFYSKYLDNYRHRLLLFLKNRVKGLPVLYCSKLELSELGNRVEENKRKKVLEIPFESKENFLLLGHSGSGKTTALLQIAYKHCCIGNRIPIIFNLTNFNGQSLSDIVCQEIFEISGERINNEFIEEALSKGTFIFLFDGLNEVCGSATVNGEKIDKFEFVLEQLNCFCFNKKYAKNKYLIACRNNSDPKEKLQIAAFALKPFIGNQMKNYLKRRGMANLFNELKNFEKLFELCRTPLMLDMAINTYTTNKALPSNKQKLYENYFNNFLYGWEAKLIKKPELVALDLEESLSKLAFRTIPLGTMFSLEFFLKNMRQICKEVSLERKEERQLIDVAIKTNLIQINGVNCSFAHHSFQEFFAAKELKNSNKLTANKLIKYIKNKEWHDVLLFLSGQIDDSSILVKNINKAYEKTKNISYLLLAARAISEANFVDKKIIDHTLKTIISVYGLEDQKYYPFWYEMDAIFKYLDNETVDGLIRILNSKNKNRHRVVYGLQYSKKGLEALLKALPTEKDAHVKYCILELVGKIKYEKSIPYLLENLNCDDAVSQATALDSLEKMGAPAKEEIEKWLKSQSFDLNYASFLNDKKKKMTKELLENIENSEDKAIYSHSLMELAKIDFKQALPHIINGLKGNDYFVKQHITGVLPKIKTESIELLARELQKGELTQNEKSTVVEELQKAMQKRSGFRKDNGLQELFNKIALKEVL